METTKNVRFGGYQKTSLNVVKSSQFQNLNLNKANSYSMSSSPKTVWKKNIFVTTDDKQFFDSVGSLPKKNLFASRKLIEPSFLGNCQQRFNKDKDLLNGKNNVGPTSTLRFVWLKIESYTL